MKQLQKVTSFLLETDLPSFALRPELLQLISILADAATVRTIGPEDLSHGETRTPNGLAPSPTMAAMCAEDYVRTIQFIRGLHAAIVDARTRLTNRPVRVLYVGCGPYAILAVPLMTIHSAAEATFTLLDVHSELIDSVKSVVDALGLADSVATYETADAGSYLLDPDQPPDVILLEIMQACLKSEPQVAITRHLLEQAAQAILVPEEVRIDLAMVDMSAEFNLTSSEQNDVPRPRDRIPVGPVFTVNRETVSSWDESCCDRLPASTLRIPNPLDKRYQPMLLTTVGVYQQHVLTDYDSGLTCPRHASIDGDIAPGVSIRFHYELGSRPRLCGEVCSQPSVD